MVNSMKLKVIIVCLLWVTVQSYAEGGHESFKPVLKPAFEPAFGPGPAKLTVEKLQAELAEQKLIIQAMINVLQIPKDELESEIAKVKAGSK